MTGTIDQREAESSAEPANELHHRHYTGVREILVPTNLTVESRKAIAYAVSLAKTWDSHLTLLHVYQEPHSLEYMRGSHVCAARARQRQTTENALELIGKWAREQYPHCRTEFREGSLCDEIVKVVKELPADLVVIGTHENKWFQRVAYGCDANAIVRLVPCPVIVIRNPCEENNKNWGAHSDSKC